MNKTKTVLITGGSGGIGLAIAQMLASEGMHVILVARTKKALFSAQKSIPTGAEIHVADVTKKGDVTKLIKNIKRLDMLVNAAGVIEPIAPIATVDPEKWRKLLDINVFGTFLMTQTCIPLLQKSRGSIINFVGGGEGAFPNFSAYAASKGAIARFTETAAAELKDKGISVFAIAPGAVNSKMTQDMIRAGSKAGAQLYKAKKQLQDSSATPEKAAKLVLWLALNSARHVSGRIISAQWDPYERFQELEEEIASSDVFTTRRIRPEDRGFSWQ